MTSATFVNMSENRKEKIIKSVIRAANKDQKALVEEYKKKNKAK